jgi:hypothetical protein
MLLRKEAKADEFEPPSKVNNLKTTLQKAGRLMNFYHYKGTGLPKQTDLMHTTRPLLRWHGTEPWLS